MNLRMMLMRGALAAAFLCVLMVGSPLHSDTPIMKLDEVRAGMKGTLRTVISGVKPENIPIEVVDVIRRLSPGRDVVIMRLLGERIKRLGVARGMSGSPVYIDGRLVGALAFSWRFMREPIAGITPIKSMMRVWRKEPGKKQADVVHAWRPGEMLPSRRFIDQLLSPRPEFAFVGPAGMTTLETPISVSGFSKSSVAALSQSLRAFDVSVVRGGAAGAPKTAPADVKLEPGGVMAVQIIRGDMEASAVGTVTEVVGNRVYGFGHPLFGNGSVEFPLATGTVHLVVPGNDMSFKLSSALKPVGTVWVDQSAGVAGEIGRQPEMLKVTLDVKRHDLVGDGRFNFEVAKDPRMMLSFFNAAMRSALIVSGKPDTKVKILVKATINVEGYAPVVIEEVHGGPQAHVGAQGAFVMPLGHIMHNPFARVNIKSVDVSSEIIPGDPRAVILYAKTDKTDYRAGEEIDVAVTLRPYRGKLLTRHYRVKLPGDVPEGPLALIVCNSAADVQMESREMPHRFRPEDVAGVLDFFRRPRPTTDIFFRLSRQQPGLAVKGRELPELPASVISVLGKQPPTEVSRFAKTLVERRETEFVIVGQQQLRIRIVKN